MDKYYFIRPVSGYKYLVSTNSKFPNNYSENKSYFQEISFGFGSFYETTYLYHNGYSLYRNTYSVQENFLTKELFKKIFLNNDEGLLFK